MRATKQKLPHYILQTEDKEHRTLCFHHVTQIFLFQTQREIPANTFTTLTVGCELSVTVAQGRLLVSDVSGSGAGAVGVSLRQTTLRA